MNPQIECTFSIEKWEETKFSKVEKGPHLIRADVEQSYKGSLDAKSTIEYLITSFDGNNAKFIGVEQIHGKLEGRTGSFVIQHAGKFHDEVSTSTFEIIPNSGTGELEGITGSGNYHATEESAIFKLTYELEGVKEEAEQK